MENYKMNNQTAYSLHDEVCEGTTFTVEGDCLDSPFSPIRLKDGQKLNVCEFAGFVAHKDIEKVRGRVCVIQYSHWGYRYFIVKEVVGIDEAAGRLRLRYYYPLVSDVFLNIKEIERVWIVEGVN